MRIEIEAAPPGPLRIIQTVPSARLAMLEGLNGIGKTLAIRVLQLCTGEMPYRVDSAAWRSLCTGLGAFTVTATEVAGASAISWQGDSRDWIDNTPPEGPVHFRRIEIDGKRASFDQIRTLFRVHRLAGDEGLIETLAQRADLAADAVRRWSRRFAGTADTPLGALEGRLATVSELVGEWSTDRYTELVAAVSGTEALRRSRAEEAAALRARIDKIVAARRIQHHLHQLSTALPDMQEEILSIDDEIARLRAARDSTHTQITTLAGLVAAATPVARELRNARRTLERNRDKLAQALDDFARAAAQAEVEATDEAVAAAVTAVESDVAELVQIQAELDQAPAMRYLLEASTARLIQAEHEGLGAQVLIDDPETDLQLTVAQAKGGMESRRAQLEGQPPPPEAAALAERVEHAHRRRAWLQAAAARSADVERYRRLVESSETRVDNALQAFDPSAVARLQELEAERRANDDRMLELAARRASLRQQMGDIAGIDSAEQLAESLAGTLAELGLEESQLKDELDRAEQDATEAAGLHREADEMLRNARRDLSRADAEVRRVSAALATDQHFAWLRQALPSYAIAAVGDAVPQQVAALGITQDLIRRVVDRVGEHRVQLAAVENALRGLARRLRGQELGTRRYVEELEGWLGDRFSEWFNIPRVRMELLPRSDGPVRVDLHTGEVRWQEMGLDRARPLEAFSSGEQAFAYTRARLAILDEDETPPMNRLIVLDEFGAFIAHDRLAQLLAYLRDRASDNPLDQVLVILPLSRDYREIAATAMSEEAARLGALAAQIEERGYALQELVR